MRPASGDVSFATRERGVIATALCAAGNRLATARHPQNNFSLLYQSFPGSPGGVPEALTGGSGQSRPQKAPPVLPLSLRKGRRQ
jgi:hypothetical protein